MDVEDENLQSRSDDDVLSCSSSILNTPRRERSNDDNDTGDSDDDSVNVTLISKPPVAATTTLSRQDRKVTKLKGEPAKPLSGAGKKRFKRLMKSGVNPEEARRLAYCYLCTHRTLILPSGFAITNPILVVKTRAHESRVVPWDQNCVSKGDQSNNGWS